MQNLSFVFLVMLVSMAVSSSVSAHAFIDLSPVAIETTNSKDATTTPEERNDNTSVLELVYKQQGEFLALVPITMKVVVKVSGDGSVSIIYPWYSALTLGNKDEVETKIKVAVDSTLHQYLVGSVQALGKAENPTMTAEERAELVVKIQSILDEAFPSSVRSST